MEKKGKDVVMIEEERMGEGEQGRNGGKFGKGKRKWEEEIEKEYGYEREKELLKVEEEEK